MHLDTFQETHEESHVPILKKFKRTSRKVSELTKIPEDDENEESKMSWTETKQAKSPVKPDPRVIDRINLLVQASQMLLTTDSSFQTDGNAKSNFPTQIFFTNMGQQP